MGKSLEEAWSELGLPVNMLSPLVTFVYKDGYELEEAWGILGYAPKYMNGVKYKMQGEAFRSGDYDLLLDKKHADIRKAHGKKLRLKEMLGV